MFGILSSPVLEDSLIGRVGGGFALACGAVNLRALIQGLSNEKEGSKVARQDLNFITYAAQLTAFVVASLSSNEGFSYFSGSFAIFWITILAVMAVGYGLIVRNNWTSMRGPMSKAAFNSDLEDKIEAFNGILFFIYGPGLYLTGSLHLGLMQSIMPHIMDCFGLLELSEASKVFNYSLETVAAGCFGMGMAAINFYVLCGPDEFPEVGETRRFADIMFWAGQIVVFVNYPETGSFYTFWVALSVILVIYLTRKNGSNAGEGYRSLV